jgi:hypothetical protein
MAAEIHRITQETLDKLEAEYQFLTTVGRTDIARVIESARLLGDLSENGDYHAAKDAQGKMESRIRQIDNVIRNHEIVERDENSEHRRTRHHRPGRLRGRQRRRPPGVLHRLDRREARRRARRVARPRRSAPPSSATRLVTRSNTKHRPVSCESRSSEFANPWPGRSLKRSGKSTSFRRVTAPTSRSSTSTCTSCTR